MRRIHVNLYLFMLYLSLRLPCAMAGQIASNRAVDINIDKSTATNSTNVDTSDNEQENEDEDLATTLSTISTGSNTTTEYSTSSGDFNNALHSTENETQSSAEPLENLLRSTNSSHTNISIANISFVMEHLDSITHLLKAIEIEGGPQMILHNYPHLSKNVKDILVELQTHLHNRNTTVTEVLQDIGRGSIRPRNLLNWATKKVKSATDYLDIGLSVVKMLF